MARERKRYDHGRSEVWERPELKKEFRLQRTNLAWRLRSIRNAQKLSQEVAAERAGIHAKHLQRIEKGRSNVTLATLTALAVAYRVPLRAFFEGAKRKAESR